jgi:hypothetical protein
MTFSKPTNSITAFCIVTFSIKTISIMAFCIMIFSIAALNITAFFIMTFSKATLSITINQTHHLEMTQCVMTFSIMPSTIKKNSIMRLNILLHMVWHLCGYTEGPYGECPIEQY